MKLNNFTAIHIIPTGIGASIGGFAGDAGPSNQLIASCVDHLIANPNVVNAGTMHNIPNNLLYTEGYNIDRFCKDIIGLRETTSNKIGIIIDSGIPENVQNININAINACKSIYGLDILGYTLTNEPVGVKYEITEDNISSGTITNSNTLLEACSKMVDSGANALAIVCYFPGDETEDYYSNGSGPDPVGGVEAIISHLVSHHFDLPCAHAPAFSFENCQPADTIVDPRAASEYFSPTFLPCVLYGLHKAPLIVSKKDLIHTDITINNVNALITPHNCLGSIPILSCLEKNIPVISINNNSTLLDITAQKLNVTDKVIELQNYMEACGYLIALKEGINPSTILRPIQKTIRI